MLHLLLFACTAGKPGPADDTDTATESGQDTDTAAQTGDPGCGPLSRAYTGSPPTYDQIAAYCEGRAASWSGGWYREGTCGALATVACGDEFGGDTWYFSDPWTLVALTWTSDDYSYGCYGYRPDCG